MRQIERIVVAAFLVCVIARTAAAVTVPVDNSTVQIINGFPGFGSPGGQAFNPTSGSYPAADAIDTGPNHALTDYASAGGGNQTFLDFKFPTIETFNSVTYVDRVTSGGANGGFVGGPFDFVTDYDLIFSNDPTFATTVDTEHVTGLTAPAGATGPADFTTTTPIPGVMAQYLRWQVVNASGGNPGASDFIFQVTGVPEPSGLAVLVLAAAAVRTRRRK